MKPEDEIVGVCGCGKPLYPCFNKDGKRIGVTHTLDDEDWHYQFWSKEETFKRTGNIIYISKPNKS